MYDMLLSLSSTIVLTSTFSPLYMLNPEMFHDLTSGRYFMKNVRDDDDEDFVV